MKLASWLKNVEKVGGMKAEDRGFTCRGFVRNIHIERTEDLPLTASELYRASEPTSSLLQGQSVQSRH
jgi:hypothetical protein